MKRNFENLNIYLDELMQDDYGQMPDAGHTGMMQEIIEKWIRNLMPCQSVLDVGCGAVAVGQEFFEALGAKYEGIALAKDSIYAKSQGINVKIMDMSFLEYPDDSFDLIFARHVLEHSPMPLLTLMEWHRVSSNYLCIVLPNAKHYGWTGLNHYSVMHPNQVEFLMNRAGWQVLWTDFSNETELRYMGAKKRTSKYEQAMGL